MTLVLRYMMLAVFLCGATSGQAQEGVSSKSVVEQVEEHNQKGVAHYEKGEFPEAIAEMLKAYHLIPEPGLLYNVARIYQKMDESELAQKYYRKFVSHEDADPDNVIKALAYLKELQNAAAQKPSSPSVVPDENPNPAPPPSESAPQPEAPPAINKAPPLSSCLPCWLGTGALVGAIGVGSATGYLALQEAATFRDNFDATTRASAAENSMAYALISDVSWGVAGVLTLVTGYLFYAHASVDDEGGAQ